jgi:glycogen synthase kinase 3 beta
MSCRHTLNSRSQVFRPRTPADAIDLVSRLLEYTPTSRLTAISAMVHPLFDELRTEGTRMPNGREFPRLFDFTKEGAARSLVPIRAIEAY